MHGAQNSPSLASPQSALLATFHCVKPSNVPTIGSHCTLELYGCPPDLLNSVAAVQAALREAAERSHSTLLGELVHEFKPQGVTALALLAESHISIHTWPELGYAACDVFTCGENTLPERACQYLAEALRAERHELRRFPRGEHATRRPDRLHAAPNAASL